MEAGGRRQAGHGIEGARENRQGTCLYCQLFFEKSRQQSVTVQENTGCFNFHTGRRKIPNNNDKTEAQILHLKMCITIDRAALETPLLSTFCQYETWLL